MFESNEPIRPYLLIGWVGWSFNVSALVVVVVVVVIMVVVVMAVVGRMVVV